MALRWQDERYVRLYTRDTVTWRLLPWQGKALLPLLLRQVDRAGILHMGGHGVDGLAAIVELPAEVVRAGLDALEKVGTVAVQGEMLAVVNFISAQEVPISDAQRKREQRERDRIKAISSCGVTALGVTGSHAMSRDVTPSHTPSQSVTPIRSDPSLTKPSINTSADAGVAEKKRKASKGKKQEPPQEPLPFRVDEALAHMAQAGRFLNSPLPHVGALIQTQNLIRKWPERQHWLSVGEWLAAGGEAWRGDVDSGLWQRFAAWLGHAKRWEEQGRPPIGNGSGKRAGPVPPSPPPKETKNATEDLWTKT